MADKIVVEVDGRPIPCDAGRPLLNAIINAGLLIETACGGQGSCHLCRVIVRQGTLPRPNSVERRALGNVLIAQGMRLSCQIAVKEPLAVEVVRREPKVKPSP